MLTVRQRAGTSAELRRPGLYFPAIGAVAFASALIPPGPSRPQWYLAALAAAAVTAAAMRFRRAPVPGAAQAPSTVPLVASVVTIGMLVYSVGTSSGMTPLMMLPLLFSALYGGRRDTATLVPLVAAAVGTVSVLNGAPLVVTGRLLLFWACMLGVVGVAVHSLRDRLGAAADAADEEARQAAVIGNATRTLAVIRDPHLVLRSAARLVAELCSPPSPGGRRGQFLLVDEDHGSFRLGADSDEAEVDRQREPVPIADHPLVREVLSTKRPVNGVIDPATLGPTAREQVTALGLTHGAYVPVLRNGSVYGLLAASGRGQAISPELFDRLQVLGAVTETSLELALAHVLLTREAETDPLTGLANRRAFDRAMAVMSRRTPFAVLAIDINSLKAVNDTHGHAAGDELIHRVAEAMASVVRHGDTLARVGGDEFSLLALDITDDGSAALAERIDAAVASVKLAHGEAAVSIGVHAAAAGDEPADAVREADARLYAAKRDQAPASQRERHAAGDAAALVGSARQH